MPNQPADQLLVLAEEKPCSLDLLLLQVVVTYGSSAVLPMPSAVSAEPYDWATAELSDWPAVVP